ncbi:lactate dehydrogenase [Streptomyces sp. NBC_01433]|uniref:lactate/malate family dehydrogenase n=1 Tax=Streptomyces sp. NBC_01433 TaxID=2903864 RepID=UPI0022537BB1|nr:lactate dehydrogenase [Streptomyces sp. NBC_01433]MCX4677631.1 lactate dehydrogenase [Streptomyces sp. NBC_01433]
MKTVGVIGAGAVGQAVSTLLVNSPWCETVMISSLHGRSADGLVTDLEDMSLVSASPVRAHRADLAQMRSCDAIVVCPRAQFTNTHTTDIRMAGLTANGATIHRLARELAGFAGPVVVVTNPVDVMTRLYAEVSGCTRVWGIGSSTDTARYRLILARMVGVPAHAVDGHVIGEHGDRAVICASSTTIYGRPAHFPLHLVREELTARPGRIAAGIGRVRSGPAGATVAALAHVLGVTDGVVELSAPRNGAYLGIPLRFNAGHPTVCLPPLDPAETQDLAAAESKLNAAYDQLRSTLKETTSS